MLHFLSCIGDNRLEFPALAIMLALKKTGWHKRHNILQGKITDIHCLGERILVDVAVGPKFTVEIVPATVERLGLQTGKDVFLIFKARSFRRLG